MFKALIHGESGHGKSTLFLSAPGPRLLIDAEDKAKWLSGEVIVWEDLSKAPGNLTSDTTVVIPVRNLETFTDCIALLQRDLPFKSYGVDSFSMIQEKLLQEYCKGQVPSRDGWQFLKVKCELLLNALLNQQSADALILIAWTTVRDDAYRPLMDGAMKDKLPHYVDLVGRVILDLDSKGITQKMLIWPQNAEGETSKTFCKDNTGLLLKAYGPVITNPSIPDMIQKMSER